MSRLKSVPLALLVALGLTLFAAPAGSAASSCPGAGIVEHVEFEDSSQGDAGGYSVYLPACYGNDDSTRYPSVYLLHGLGEGDSHWLRLGMGAAADRAITRGDIAPMVLVMADGGPNFGPGHDKVLFDDYLVDELVPRIDASYRTIGTRDGRAVGGISRGGAHALAVASVAPEAFTAVGGHSPRVEDTDALASRLTSGGVRVWLDIGRGDHLRNGPVTLARRMRDADGTVQLHMPAGVHQSSYWQSHLDQYLAFYDEAFRLASRADR